MSDWINVKEDTPNNGDIVNIAVTTNEGKLVTICQIDNEFIKGQVCLFGVGFSGYEWEYDFEWEDVKYWKLAPKHPDL